MNLWSVVNVSFTHLERFTTYFHLTARVVVRAQAETMVEASLMQATELTCDDQSMLANRELERACDVDLSTEEGEMVTSTPSGDCS